MKISKYRIQKQTYSCGTVIFVPQERGWHTLWIYRNMSGLLMTPHGCLEASYESLEEAVDHIERHIRALKKPKVCNQHFTIGSESNNRGVNK